MANVIIPNYPLVTSSNIFHSIWKLTRAMKKAGWTYKSSSDGYTKDTSGVASADLWGGNVDPATDTYSAIGTTTTGTQSLPSATLNVASASSFPTSGTILVASSNGWQTVSYTGTTATSFTGCTGGTGAVPATSPVGSAAINMDGVSAWWNAQGPSTLKIPISTASVGTFIRGENITQATSLAQGELLGYLFDPAPSGGGGPTGYLVVAPRVDGYGADPHGWDHSHVITGSVSGATITPSSTAIEFMREVVFWKQNTIYSGTIYYQCVDGYISETTSRFSYLATNASGCTGTVAPGGGGTSNGFPTAGSFVVEGTAGANTPANWCQIYTNNISNFGRAMFMATSASYAANTSADGSFTMAVGSPYSGSSGSFVGFTFTRVDYQEDGDVDPYVWYAPNGTTLYSTSRTSNTTTLGQGSNSCWDPATIGTTLTYFLFWRRRGRGDTNDAFQNGTLGLTQAYNTGVVLSTNIWDREKIANTYNDIYMLEDVWCISAQTLFKTRKGICRWIKAVQGGSSCDLYGNKTWIQLTHANATSSLALVVGPWDGATVQTQA